MCGRMLVERSEESAPKSEGGMTMLKAALIFIIILVGFIIAGRIIGTTGQTLHAQAATTDSIINQIQ